MANHAQIIPLKPYQTQTHSALLATLRGQLVRALVPALQQLFDEADDVLFRLAEQATSNLEQGELFEAMRSIRLARKGLERAVIQEAAGGLMQLNQRRQPPATEEAELSLLGNDELEEAVAIDSMHARVLSELSGPFNALTARLSAVSGQRLSPEQNPLGAYALAQVFARTIHTLSLKIAHKLVLYKLFEKHVLANQYELFSKANEALVGANILPDLAPEKPKKSASDDTSQTVEQAFSVIKELLATQREAQPVRGVPISENDLLKLLSHLQNRPQANEGALNQKVQHWVEQIGQKSGTARVVEQDNADVINLVSMLFEFILDDRTLPDGLRALISRLQIPLLKVALLDKSFFTRTQHPARRLLNEIASAALGISHHAELAHDNLYLAIEQVVNRVLTEFEQNIELFDELLAHFTEVTAAQARRSALLEQRLRDAELGRAKAQNAKQEVSAHLAPYLTDPSLASLHSFIDNPWRSVLMLAHLKYGEESEVLKLRLSQLAQLAEAVLYAPSPLDLAAYDEALEETGLEPLLHQQQMQHLKRLVETPNLQQPPAHVAVAPSAKTQPNEPVTPCPAELQVEAQVTQTLPEDALAWAQALRVGSWVEVCQDDQSKLRCKLAAMIKITSRYVFVNRNGQKVLEHSLESLASVYQAQKIRLLDDALLFDRALESVIGTLRDLKQHDL